MELSKEKLEKIRFVMDAGLKVKRENLENLMADRNFPPEAEKEVMLLLASIRYWQMNIIAPLKAGDAIVDVSDKKVRFVWKSTGDKVSFAEVYCELCQEFLDIDDCEETCLLDRTNYYYDEESAYWKFLNHPCLETAVGMVNALDYCIKKRIVKQKREELINR